MSQYKTGYVSVTKGSNVVYGYGTSWENLLSNPGFETGDFTGWNIWGLPLIREIVTSPVWQGSYSYHHKGDSLDEGSLQTIAVEPNTEYTISCWCYCISYVSIRISTYVGSWHSRAPTKLNEWEQLTFTVTTASDQTSMTVRIGGEGEAYFDAVQIEKGSSASPFTEGVRGGDLFSIDGERAIYVVDSVVGSTCLTLTGNYCGSSKTKRTYTITRSFTTNLFLPKVERRDVYWPKYLSYAINILDKGEARGCDPLSDGLVLYFPFHESSLISGSTFYDVSPMGNNGTIVGATWTSEGMSFDGEDDYVEVPDSDSLNLNTLTVSVWFKSTYEGEWFRTIVSKYGYQTAQESWGLGWLGESVLGFYIRDSVDLNSAWSGAGEGLDGRWHHLVGIASDAAVQFWMDGILKQETARTAGDIRNTRPVSMGRHLDSYVPETIGSVRIYNRALSAEEVNRLYQLGRSYTGLPTTGSVYIIDNKLYFRVVDTWHSITLT